MRSLLNCYKHCQIDNSECSFELFENDTDYSQEQIHMALPFRFSGAVTPVVSCLEEAGEHMLVRMAGRGLGIRVGVVRVSMTPQSLGLDPSRY